MNKLREALQALADAIERDGDPAFAHLLIEARAALAEPPSEGRELTDAEIEHCRQQGYAHGGLRAQFDFVRAARAVIAADRAQRAPLTDAVAAERERCASICDGIGAGHAGEARRLKGQHSTHAAGRRDGANECAWQIRAHKIGGNHE